MAHSFVVWLTGLPGAGKSIIASRLKDRLLGMGFNAVVLEGEEVRRLIIPSPTYEREERDFFYRVIVVMAKYLYDSGISVIIDAAGHRMAYREYARSLIERFIEVYVYCPIDICIERDVKGLYQRAMKGEISGLPGLQVKYEEPENPDVRVDTSGANYDDAVNIIISAIIKKLLVQ